MLILEQTKNYIAALVKKESLGSDIVTLKSALQNNDTLESSTVSTDNILLVVTLESEAYQPYDDKLTQEDNITKLLKVM